MANFTAVTTCNGPTLSNAAAVEDIISRYYVNPDLFVGIGSNDEDQPAQLFLYGDGWPEAWKLSDGANVEEFNPHVTELYEEGADGFVQLLRDIAPHLNEPLTVQAVGNTKCRFPLAACEWHVLPGEAEVEITQFQHSVYENAPMAAC